MAKHTRNPAGTSKLNRCVRSKRKKRNLFGRRSVAVSVVFLGRHSNLSWVASDACLRLHLPTSQADPPYHEAWEASRKQRPATSPGNCWHLSITSFLDATSKISKFFKWGIGGLVVVKVINAVQSSLLLDN